MNTVRGKILKGKTNSELSPIKQMVCKIWKPSSSPLVV